MKFKKIFFAFMVASSTLLSQEARADNTYMLLLPPSYPLMASLSSGFNFAIVGGGIFARGKTRDNVLGVSPWQRGWISKNPNLEVSVGYTFFEHLGVGLQGSTAILSSNVYFHGPINENLAVGAKIGVLSSLYTTLTLHPTHLSFLSVTPAFILNQFGAPSKIELDNREDPFNQPPQVEKIGQSRFILNAQLSGGVHVWAMDLGLIVAYGYAPGNGLLNSYVFDDTITKHFFRTSLAVEF